jgi:hypothetical protein
MIKINYIHVWKWYNITYYSEQLIYGNKKEREKVLVCERNQYKKATSCLSLMVTFCKRYSYRYSKNMKLLPMLGGKVNEQNTEDL